MGKKLALAFLTAYLALHAQTATVSASPTSVTFTYQIGGTIPAAQTVSVRASSGTVTYSSVISPTSALWLTAEPDSGKLPASLSVRVNPTGLAVGTYIGQIDITVSGVTAVLSVPVTLTVMSPLPTLMISPTTVTLVTSPTPTLTQAITLSTAGTPYRLLPRSPEPRGFPSRLSPASYCRADNSR